MARKREQVTTTPRGGEITIVSYGPPVKSGSSRPAKYATDATLSGGLRGFLERRTKVSPETLQQNLKLFLDAMEKTLDGIPRLLAGYALEEIELSVEVSGEGEIGLLGTGGKLSGTGSISLKLTRVTVPAANTP